MSEFLKKGTAVAGRTVTKLDKADLAEIVSVELVESTYGFTAVVKTKSRGTLRFLWDFMARTQSARRIPVARLRWLTVETSDKPMLTDRDE